MRPRSDSVERDLRSFIKGDVEFDNVTRQLYATDAGLNQIEPLGVVSPRDADDLILLVTYAAEQGLSLVPRGMGSGLAGGAVGAGIQVDFTRYMNRILEVAPDGSWARVQPGVVMAELNQYARRFGTFFAPDPSSENYCSLGGMIGTNSSGARTVAYGGTKDHVLALHVVLADGSLFDARPLPLGGSELDRLLTGPTAAGRALATILPELRSRQKTILAAMPRVVKNCSGYRVEALLAGEDGGEDPAGLVHLQKLFVGAEGSLGLVAEATLNLVPLPAERGIAMAYFPSVFACGEAVPGILALSPTAVEIMDSRFLALVRRHDSHVDAVLPARTDTALLIEFEGRDDAELGEKFSALRCHLDDTGALKLVRAANREETDRLWTVRKSAVALTLRMPGPRRALPFIEDVAVHPTEVPGYVDFLQRLLDKEGAEAVMYGHVGDGNIHARPLLDPKDPADLRTMQRLYDAVSEYVLGIRGTMSGEHGDGLLRTPYVRRMYGNDIYALFTRIKNAFDPSGVMNPGKKIGPQDGSDSLERHLRYGSEYHTVAQSPILRFPPGEYELEIEKCHGCGQCKSVVLTTMCPTYKATRREHASPRAKANLLRGIITGKLDPAGAYGLAAAKVVTDYCIVCGMCAVECPSRVNIPKLMLEAKSKYRTLHGAKPVERILGRAETVSRLGHFASPLANRLMNRPALRGLVGPLVGIDRRRPMARFARQTYRESVAARGAAVPAAAPPPMDGAGQPAQPAVAYFYDMFANYNEPELALAVERVLAAHGVRLIVPDQRASGIPEMLYGFARQAGQVAEFNVRALLPHVRAGAVPVSSEPTATFAFKVHYPDYLGSSDCSLVANAAHDLGEFLVRFRADHRATVPVARPLWAMGQAALRPDATWSVPAKTDLVGDPVRIAYHQPCHLKAQQIGNPGLELLREIPGVEVIDMAAGCCGMAGTFGMKADTYDLSMLTGKPLFDRIAEVAPALVASECSTCRMQIAQGTGLGTVHPITLLAEAYGT
ncbi:MAG: FAD-linked oxidase C-terminal domain-containing protein [bacterium]